MDINLREPRLSPNATVEKAFKKKGSMFRFIGELKAELKKVSWTKKEELQLATKAVIVSIFLFGLGIYLIDLAVKSCLDFIAFVAHLVFG